MPRKQNVVADGLSRINLEKGTYDMEQEDIGKVFSIIQAREDLERIPVSYTHLDVYKRQW